MLLQLIVKHNCVVYASWNLEKFVHSLNQTDFDDLEEQINKNCKLSYTEIFQNAYDYMYMLELEFTPDSEYKLNPTEMKHAESKLDNLITCDALSNIEGLIELFSNIELLTHDNLYMLYELLSSGADVNCEGIRLTFKQD